jgi:hypothetical protein
MTQDKSREAFGRYVLKTGREPSWADQWQREHFETWQASESRIIELLNSDRAVEVVANAIANGLAQNLTTKDTLFTMYAKAARDISNPNDHYMPISEIPRREMNNDTLIECAAEMAWKRDDPHGGSWIKSFDELPYQDKESYRKEVKPIVDIISNDRWLIKEQNEAMLSEIHKLRDALYNYRHGSAVKHPQIHEQGEQALESSAKYAKEK